jgi:hypothetical protein
MPHERLVTCSHFRVKSGMTRPGTDEVAESVASIEWRYAPVPYRRRPIGEVRGNAAILARGL